MTETAVSTATDADLMQTQFVTEMDRQMRAIDPYGEFDRLSTAELLEPFILTKE